MSSEKGVATVAERPVDFLCDLERSPVVSSDPHRRGPKKHRFTRTQEMLLYLIAGETVLNGGVRCTKRQLADLVGRNVKTIDRCIASLRREGLIETEMNFDESGGQVSSLYRAVIGQMPGLQDNTGALAAPGHSDLWGEAPRQNEEGEDEPSPREKQERREK